jgi:MFS transporter, SP family, sugar:H+ symporter
MVSFPKLSAPRLRFSKPSFSSHVYYDQYDPNKSEGKDVRKSLAGLDYSPLRRVTWASFNMGVLISMGGFM